MPKGRAKQKLPTDCANTVLLLPKRVARIRLAMFLGGMRLLAVPKKVGEVIEMTAG